MSSRAFFRKLKERFGPHTVDLFASGANNQCEKFYSLHWCRGTAGVNAFAFNSGGESAWINCPFRLIGKVWRKLQSDARNNCDVACSAVGVGHLVDALSAGCETFH